MDFKDVVPIWTLESIEIFHVKLELTFNGIISIIILIIPCI